MSASLLEATDLTKRFGGLVATDRVSIEVRMGEVHALIGPNGAGKTTLLAQLAGELAPDGGTIRFEGQDITVLPPHARTMRGLARSFQTTSVLRAFSALDNVALAVQARAGHSFRFWRPARCDSALNDSARAVLARIGLERRANSIASELSHGEQRQLEIGMALASAPRVLLLDEPTAGMGSAESERMVGLLRSLRGTVGMLLVEHDMDAVFALADRVTVMTYGRVIASGAPEAVRAAPDVRAAYLGVDEAG